METSTRVRYFFIAGVILTIASSIMMFLAIREHGPHPFSRAQQIEIWAKLGQMRTDIEDYACDDLDGMKCYLVKVEFESKGLRAAIEKREELRKLVP